MSKRLLVVIAVTVISLFGLSGPTNSQTVETFIFNISNSCTSTGQLCDSLFSVPIETGSVLQAQYSVARTYHCSSIRVHLFVDETLKVTTGFLGWPGAPSPFNILPLDTGLLDLGTVSPGTHKVSVQAEGQVGGCNGGQLRGWSGSLKVLTSNQAPLAQAGDNMNITSEDYCRAVQTIHGTATDSDNDSLTYRWLEGQTVLLGSTSVGLNGEADLNLCNTQLTLGTHTLTLEVTDGKTTATDDMLLTIENSAPHAAPTGGGTYQIGAVIPLGGQVSDFDGDLLTYWWSEEATEYHRGQIQPSKGGTGITLPDYNLSSLNLGTHTVTLTVSDGINQTVSSNITVFVIDTTAPTLSPDPDKSILWPPNHQMVNVTIITHANDDSGSPTLSAVVTSNEPQNGLGDGDMAPDWTTPAIDPETGVITLQLRAERSGSGNGRIYTVTITATDSSNNISTAPVKILVPHDKGK